MRAIPCLPGIHWVATIAFVVALSSLVQANDAIFAAQPAAAASVDWKSNYFTIDGKPVVINAGEIHYCRVPRELWRERLVKVKRAGLNTVATRFGRTDAIPAPETRCKSSRINVRVTPFDVSELGQCNCIRPRLEEDRKIVCSTRFRGSPVAGRDLAA